MRNQLFVVAAIALITIIAVSIIGIFDDSDATTVEDDSIFYNVYESGKYAEVTAPFVGTYSGDVEIKSSVEYNGKTYDVTSIGSGAFNGCTGLKSIDLKNVTSIGESAFYGCTGLTSLDFKNVTSISKNAFYGCTGLTSLDLKNVTSIGSSAFYGCTSLTSLDLKNVTSLNYQTFYGCTGLKSIDLRNVTSISSSAFNGCTGLTEFRYDGNTNYSVDGGVLFNSSKSTLIAYPGGKETYAVPDETETIGYNAFNGCTGLKSIDLKNVTSIGESAFYGCTGLTSLDLKNVTSIGQYAFYGCTGLKSIDLNKVTSIGKYIFEGCTGLTSLDLKNVTSIGDYAFYGCTGLTSLDLKNVTSIGKNAFSVCTGLISINLRNVTSIGGNAFSRCTSLTEFRYDGNTNYSVDGGVLFNSSKSTLIAYPGGKETYAVPDETETIGEFALYGCTGLKSINLNNVTSIGKGAFYECTSLTSIDLKNVTSIGDRAFQECTSMTYVNLPDSITSIGCQVFQKCTSLTSIDLKNVTSLNICAFDGCTGLTSIDLKDVTSIGQNAFSGCTGLTSLDLNKVTSIGSNAFFGCTGLTSIDLKNVTSIGDYAFFRCTSLTEFRHNGNANYSVDGGVLFDSSKSTLIAYPGGKETYAVPDETKTIGQYSFSGCTGLTSIDLNKVTSIDNRAFDGCTGLTSIDLKDVTSIGDYAFNGCTGLTSIDLKNVTSIGQNAFSGCTGLTSIDLKNVTSIGDYAFNGCTGLTSIDLKNVTSIGDYAFKLCTNLRTLTFPENVPSVGTALFRYSSSDVTLLVPSASYEMYEAGEDWQPYVNHTFKDVSIIYVTDVDDQIYCGSAIEPSVIVTDGSKTLLINVDYTISYSDNVNAGVAKLTVSGKGEYGGSIDRTFTINPKAIIVKADDMTKVYGKEDPVFTATVTGLIGSDSVAYKLVRTGGQSVGTYVIEASGDTVQGNYSVTYQNGTFTITEPAQEPIKQYDWYYLLWLIPAIQFLFLVLVLIYNTVRRH